MSTPTTQASLDAARPEVTGLVSAHAYAAGMCEAFSAAASGAESFAGSLTGHGVHGPAVAAAERAADLTAQANTAWVAAATALDRQTIVRQAYLSAPGAGSRTFVTDGADGPAAALAGAVATEDDTSQTTGMGDTPGIDGASWTAADTDEAPSTEPVPQHSRRPRMNYRQWHRSQLVNLGATARDEHFWQCPTTGCKLWAGPYPNPSIAKQAGFEHVYRCEKTDYYRRGRTS